MPNEIWVVVEKARHTDNIAAISRELLGKGRDLANASGAPLAALVLGAGVGELAERAFAYGADKAYVVDDAALAQYTTDGYVGAAAALAQQYAPALILTGSSFQMRDFSAALAAELGAGLAIDATNITIEGDQISAVRPSHGGNVINTIAFGSARPAVVAVRKQVFPEGHEARAAVEDQQMRTAANLQAGGIAAISDELRPWASQGSSNAPEAQRKISGRRHRAIPPYSVVPARPAAATHSRNQPTTLGWSCRIRPKSCLVKALGTISARRWRRMMALFGPLENQLSI